MREAVLEAALCAFASTQQKLVLASSFAATRGLGFGFRLELGRGAAVSGGVHAQVGRRACLTALVVVRHAACAQRHGTPIAVQWQHFKGSALVAVGAYLHANLEGLLCPLKERSIFDELAVGHPERG